MLPDPLCTGAYQSDIISVTLQLLKSLITKRLCIEGLATRHYSKMKLFTQIGLAFLTLRDGDIGLLYHDK